MDQDNIFDAKVDALIAKKTKEVNAAKEEKKEEEKEETETEKKTKRKTKTSSKNGMQ